LGTMSAKMLPGRVSQAIIAGFYGISGGFLIVPT